MTPEDHAQRDAVLSSCPEVRMTETRDDLHLPDDMVRQQFAIMLEAMCFRAKREVPKCGDAEHPTPWDLLHRRINELLTDMLG